MLYETRQISRLRSLDPPLPVTHHEYCKVQFGLEVAVQCTARNEIEAEQLIETVFRGKCLPPRGFCSVFEAEAIDTFVRRLKTMLDTGDIDLVGLGVHDVLVTGFADPVQQLECRP
jgi:hypothetical protein